MLMEYYLKEYAGLFANTDRNVWNYEDGCVLIGLNALYEATGNKTYFDYIKTFMDRYIEEDGHIRLYRMEDYNVDFIPAGRVLYLLYEKTGLKKYRMAIETLMEQIRRQPRTQHGSFWHKAIYPNQVWLDGLYMALPYYAMYQLRFSNGSLDDIVMQFENARKYLYDEKQKLYYHAFCATKDIFWANPKTGCSANFWTRAIGWHLMAFADIYAMMPNGKLKERMGELYMECASGVIKRRDDKSGMFMQLTALPDTKGNYPETSGTLMIAYSLMKGTRFGLLPAEFGRTGAEVLMSVEKNEFRLAGDELHLGGICKGAGLGPDGNFRRDGSAEYYISEDVVEDEQKGVGVCMMAYAEWLCYSNKVRHGGPRVGIFMKAYDPIMPDEIARLAIEGKRPGRL
ncbi:glycoside hydrolase family 88/105 protein [Treponema parvum]|uniref:glycoside hydrolase family 88/105 protein n=1 Tax=Treponema parvum TaxID=138851 RepID=UPI001AEC0521|nr:glycoside hydrolase family 88 protein [Treponema parvum]QTQ15312.1 glycoside hydrolase family 88 protein [Treponema parvum]